MAEATGNVTAAVEERPDGWWVKIIFDDGQFVYSDRPLPTKADAVAAVKAWCASVGGTFNLAQ